MQCLLGEDFPPSMALANTPDVRKYFHRSSGRLKSIDPHDHPQSARAVLKQPRLEAMVHPRDTVFLDLIRSLLRLDPAARCTARSALNHRFFTALRGTLDVVGSTQRVVNLAQPRGPTRAHGGSRSEVQGPVPSQSADGGRHATPSSALLNVGDRALASPVEAATAPAASMSDTKDSKNRRRRSSDYDALGVTSATRSAAATSSGDGQTGAARPSASRGELTLPRNAWAPPQPAVGSLEGLDSRGSRVVIPGPREVLNDARHRSPRAPESSSRPQQLTSPTSSLARLTPSKL